VSFCDGLSRNVTGDLSTIMAGLACGEPNPFAWNILWDFVSCFTLGSILKTGS